MLVSIRHRLAFLAMTKAGSTAVEAALAPHCEISFGGDPRIKHMTARKFDRFMRPYLKSVGAEDVETVCLFREPTAWLGSWYRYRQRPELTGRAQSTAGLSFAEFVEGYLSDPQPTFAQVGRPARFVEGRGERPGVDRLFRYEAFDRFAAFLSDRIGAEIRFGQLNVSPEGPPLDLPDARAARHRAEMAEDFAIHAGITP
ncbi:MAG: hypothetical protein AAFW69_04670 [Pseudomonadota bacterium]